MRAAFPPTGSRAAAWSAFREATVVTLDGTPEPVTITVTGPGEGASAASHLQLRTTPHAEATVVLVQRGSGTLADNLEVVLADGSRLTLVVTEEWADDAVHVGAHHFALGRDATLRTTTIALGGDLVRVSPTVAYRAPGRRRRARRRWASPTRASTWSSGCSSTTASRTAARG